MTHRLTRLSSPAACARGVLLGLIGICATSSEASATVSPSIAATQEAIPPNAASISSATAPAAPATSASVTPTDETAFYQRLQYVSHKRNLTGLAVDGQVLEALANGAADVVVATLSAQGATGNQNSNIALVRIQHWCNRVLSAQPVDSKAQLERIAPAVSPQRLARAAGVYVAEHAYMQRARQGCGQAHFDFGAIEARLRSAAEAGDPASATELAQFLRDPAKHEELLERAAAKNFAPAQYALATNRLIAVRKGQTTENVASIRLLLKQAGQTLSRAKVDLANCMALGCDGHPADTATAAAFGTDAARDGEPLAFVSMVQMPWGGRLTRLQILAWQYYGDKLNELGCTGDAYVPNSVAFARTLAALEKDQDTKVLEQAKAQLDTLWQQNGERARKQQGCD